VRFRALQRGSSRLGTLIQHTNCSETRTVKLKRKSAHASESGVMRYLGQ
jgi:hypothetical protein